MAAPKGNKYAKGCKTNGRPSLYKPEYAELAHNYCLLGATNPRLAELFGVSVTTIEAWLRTHKDFSSAVMEGRDAADANVARSLYHRALGYTHPEEKIFNNAGEVIRVETVKHYPPDTNAANLWLMNRRPDLWRDRKELNVNHSGGVALLPEMPKTLESWTEEAQKLIQQQEAEFIEHMPDGDE